MMYDIGFLIFSIFYLPTLIFKGKLHGDFMERFGIYDVKKRERLAAGKRKIWIQAVSVGEVALCKTFIPLLKDRFKPDEIILSTITRTGNDLAKKMFSKDVTVIYFPLDFSFVVKKVVALIKPTLYIMVETEIWPNLLKELFKNNIPSVLVNGRISDRSFDKYKLVKPSLKNILDRVNVFCMQSENDRERIKYLGAGSDRVKVTGNMKFDIEIAAHKEPRNIREAINLRPEEELLVAGSTHHGEEEILLDVFRELKKEFAALRLLIAPRHIERVGEIQHLVKRFGFKVALVSQPKNLNQKSSPGLSLGYFVNNSQPSTSDILILDTIGQLNDMYSVATLVFIGGSLIKHGGQNPIEPAIFEKPILVGPNMFNFKNIAFLFLANDAAVQVRDKEELLEEARFLLNNKDERIKLGLAAGRVVHENRGATGRNIEIIKKII